VSCTCRMHMSENIVAVAALVKLVGTNRCESVCDESGKGWDAGKEV